MPPELAQLGLRAPAERARAVMAQAAKAFPRETATLPPDPRIAAIAAAIRDRMTLRLRARSRDPVSLRPQVLACGPDGWSVFGPPLAAPVAQADWADINISAPRGTVGQSFQAGT